MVEQIPSIGRIVHYVLSHGRYPGSHRPAIIVNVWDENPTINSLVQLQVFTDCTNDYAKGEGNGSTGIMWATSVHYDEAEKKQGTWHWPERV